MTYALELIRPPHPLSYAAGLALQERLFDRIVAGRAARTLTAACADSSSRPAAAAFAGGVILLQHTPTITLGKEATPAELLVPEATLAAQGIEVVRTDRGGKITVHAPGQWVLYPVLDLNLFGKDVTAHIRQLEEVAIRAAARLGVTAGRIPGVSGAWITPPGPPGGAPTGQREAKLCAVGIAVRKWITRHGLCFNVAADMPVYRYIVPCGQADRGVTSLQTLTGRPDAAALMAQTATALLEEFASVFDVTLTPAAAQPASV